MLDLRPDLRLGFFDFAFGLVQDAALAQFLVSAAPGGNLPDDLATLMLGAFLHAGITGIGTDHVFVAVQQLIDLRDIGHIGRCAHHAMHQARLFIHTDMGLHAEVPLIAFLGLVHFRVALAVLVLGRTRRMNQRGIDDGALAQRQAAITQIAIDHAQNPRRQLVFFQQATEVEDGVLALIEN